MKKNATPTYITCFFFKREIGPIPKTQLISTNSKKNNKKNHLFQTNPFPPNFGENTRTFHLFHTNNNCERRDPLGPGGTLHPCPHQQEAACAKTPRFGTTGGLGGLWNPVGSPNHGGCPGLGGKKVEMTYLQQQQQQIK